MATTSDALHDNQQQPTTHGCRSSVSGAHPAMTAPPPKVPPSVLNQSETQTALNPPTDHSYMHISTDRRPTENRAASSNQQRGNIAKRHLGVTSGYNTSSPQLNVSKKASSITAAGVTVHTPTAECRDRHGESVSTETELSQHASVPEVHWPREECADPSDFSLSTQRSSHNLVHSNPSVPLSDWMEQITQEATPRRRLPRPPIGQGDVISTLHHMTGLVHTVKKQQHHKPSLGAAVF